MSSTVCKELHQSTYKSALFSTYPAMQVYAWGRGVFVWWPQLELGGRGTLHQSQPTKSGRLLLKHRTTGTNFHQLFGQLLVAKISRNSLRHTFSLVIPLFNCPSLKHSSLLNRHLNVLLSYEKVRYINFNIHTYSGYRKYPYG